MKKLLLLGLFPLLFHPSYADTLNAIFVGDLGAVTLTESAKGLLINLNFKLEPNQKYKIKLLSNCRSANPYHTKFRHLFEVEFITDGAGKVARSAHFLAIKTSDLQYRDLNTLGLYRLEKSYWRMVDCVSLQLQNESP